MANSQLGLADRSVLLALMAVVEEVSNPDLYDRCGVRVDRGVRERLESLGYLTSRRTNAPGRPYTYELTDLGWRRCLAELDADAPPGAPKATRLLYPVLNLFGGFLRRSGLALVDVVDVDVDAAGATSPETPTSAPVSPTGASTVTDDRSPPCVTVSVPDRVRTGYEQLADGPGAWVSLTRLRAALADLSRHEVDSALRELDLRPGVSLIPEANQKTLSPDDRVAAIRVGGEDKHLISVERS